MNLKEVCHQLTSTTLNLFTRKQSRYFPDDYKVQHLGYSCLLLIGASCQVLNDSKTVCMIENKEYAVPDVFFIVMTIRHQLLFADEVEQAINKNSNICSMLLLRTNNLISRMMDNQAFIHSSEIHNFLVSFRQELPKLSVVFGGSDQLPVEF